MLTTGILSLNVHDSLTFEGTELCLNPDIFVVEHGFEVREASTSITEEEVILKDEDLYEFRVHIKPTVVLAVTLDRRANGKTGGDKFHHPRLLERSDEYQGRRAQTYPDARERSVSEGRPDDERNDSPLLG